MHYVRQTQKTTLEHIDTIGYHETAGYLVLVALTFAFFYPHLTAIPVANWLDKLYFPFDRGNLLDNNLFNWE